MGWNITGNIRGSQGPVAINWTYQWSNVTAYSVRDGVTRLGNSYVAMAANTNVDPATDTHGIWLLLASKGDTGATGPQPPLGSATPNPLGVAGAGASANAAHEDHVHAAAPAFTTATGTITATTTNPTGYTAAIRYFLSGKLLIFNALYQFGGNIGSGTYTFNLGIPGGVQAVANQLCPGWYDVTGTGGQRYSCTGLMGTTAGVSIDRIIDQATSIGLGSSSRSWSASAGLFRFQGAVELQ